MTKKSKISLGVGVVLLLLVGVFIGLNKWVAHKLKTALEESEAIQEFVYKDIDVNLLGGDASITAFSFHTGDKKVSAEKLAVKGVSVFKYLFQDKIAISAVQLTAPNVVIYSEEDKEKTKGKKKEKNDFDLAISSFEISHATLKLAKNDTVKNTLFLRLPTVELNEITANENSLASNLPFKYGDFQVEADSIFFNINDEHDMMAKKLAINSSFLQVNDISMVPLYDKQEFQKHIPYEKDRVELVIPELKLNSWKWGLENDSLKIESPLAQLNQMDLALYRDKRVNDDPRHKKMYSKMIRELPIKLNLDTLKVKNAKLQYQEKVKTDRRPGLVKFTELNASIYNLTNMGMRKTNFPTTSIEVSTYFMGEADLKVNWSFDISNKMDEFRISGHLNNISSQGINQFLKPALNVAAQGGIRDMQFDYSGNKNKASGEMKLIYKDFKVEVLKNDGESKSGFLSALANLIIRNEATSEEKTQKNITATRTINKSFWNYLWKMVRNGALKSFL
ncbi:hypothetical protein SAMN05444483_10581 [Salegentibacter echinorum]|uniref:AsmA-like C-terminal region n=1 Tax=Salegentibacter echinorum TaxID=1073325 RepID=A0A1M5HBW6_SALEC|nr:hypothetical protein [Salegentibacter echinorum]SHG13446.1 hypothetical protein SAMN05444483_10581 [Salegentibacter echinorum]